MCESPSDTGLYYLNSRYYDAETGRFINEDAFASTDVGGVLSANMFAYCENNPVNHNDPNGEYSIRAAVAVVSGIVGFAISSASQISNNMIKKAAGIKTNWYDGVFAAGLGGATYNTVSVLTNSNIAAGYASAFVESTVSEIGKYTSGKEKLNSENLKKSALTAGTSTALNGSAYAACGILASKKIPLDYNKAIEKGFTVSHLFDTIKQAAIQSGAYLAGKYTLLGLLG